MVYVVRCRDGTLYTGVTNDLERRVAAHNAGRGARYTRARGPVALVYREPAPNRGAAQRRFAIVVAVVALVAGFLLFWEAETRYGRG